MVLCNNFVLNNPGPEINFKTTPLSICPNTNLSQCLMHFITWIVMQAVLCRFSENPKRKLVGSLLVGS